jgi:hypothetical protein
VRPSAWAHARAPHEQLPRTCGWQGHWCALHVAALHSPLATLAHAAPHMPSSTARSSATAHAACAASPAAARARRLPARFTPPDRPCVPASRNPRPSPTFLTPPPPPSTPSPPSPSPLAPSPFPCPTRAPPSACPARRPPRPPSAAHVAARAPHCASTCARAATCAASAASGWEYGRRTDADTYGVVVKCDKERSRSQPPTPAAMLPPTSPNPVRHSAARPSQPPRPLPPPALPALLLPPAASLRLPAPAPLPWEPRALPPAFGLACASASAFRRAAAWHGSSEQAL